MTEEARRTLRDEGVEAIEFHTPLDARGHAEFSLHAWDGDHAQISQRLTGDPLPHLWRRLRAGVPVLCLPPVKEQECKR